MTCVRTSCVALLLPPGAVVTASLRVVFVGCRVVVGCSSFCTKGVAGAANPSRRHVCVSHIRQEARNSHADVADIADGCISTHGGRWLAALASLQSSFDALSFDAPRSCLASFAQDSLMGAVIVVIVSSSFLPGCLPCPACMRADTLRMDCTTRERRKIRTRTLPQS